MGTILPDVPPTNWTIADVQARLPGSPANRIRVYPTPGTATEQDVFNSVVLIVLAPGALESVSKPSCRLDFSPTLTD